MSAGAPCQVWVVAVVGYPALCVLPPIMFARGCTGLMAGLVQLAGGAVVANLDLVAVSPAVPDFVPSWFGVTPVVGANTCLRQ